MYGNTKWTYSAYIDEMLEKSAEEVVHDRVPAFFSRWLLVEKALGGQRPVIVLSSLNTFVTHSKFRMEMVASVLASIRKSDFVFLIGLKDAPFQIPIIWNLDHFFDLW